MDKTCRKEPTVLALLSSPSPRDSMVKVLSLNTLNALSAAHQVFSTLVGPLNLAQSPLVSVLNFIFLDFFWSDITY